MLKIVKGIVLKPVLGVISERSHAWNFFSIKLLGLQETDIC